MRHHFIIAEFFDAYNELTPTQITHHVDLRKTKITSLGNLEYVRGSLNLQHLKSINLGNLHYVRGSLSIEDTNITSLGKLAFVGGRIFCDMNEQYERLQAENNGRFRIVGYLSQ